MEYSFITITLRPTLICGGRISLGLIHGSLLLLLLHHGSVSHQPKQFSSSLQDSSQYSGRSQSCGSLDGLHLSSYFQVLYSLYQSFGDCSKRTNYKWYKRHFHVPQFFSKVGSRYLSFFSLSFNFTLWSAGTEKVHNSVSSLFFCWLLLGVVV